MLIFKYLFIYLQGEEIRRELSALNSDVVEQLNALTLVSNLVTEMRYMEPIKRIEAEFKTFLKGDFIYVVSSWT
jgi:hypothetical protein